MDRLEERQIREYKQNESLFMNLGMASGLLLLSSVAYLPLRYVASFLDNNPSFIETKGDLLVAGAGSILGLFGTLVCCSIGADIYRERKKLEDKLTEHRKDGKSS